MIAHIIGNGPSKKDFKNDPEGEIFGCNLPDPGIPFKATFIMDKVCIDHIHNNKIKLDVPVIVPFCLKKLVVRCDPAPVVYDTIQNGVHNGQSTGHKGVVYLLESGYTEIHMWGFDSLFRETVESDTHQKIPEGPVAPNNWKPWRKNWEKIFNHELGKKCKFVIHGKPSS